MRYVPVDDLALITCYFNPSRYHTKLENYQHFKAPIVRSGLQLWTIECAFGNDAFTLTPTPDCSNDQLIQIRSQSILWQKERLLNHVIQQLPQSIQKVAWLDCDILFSNPHWAIETSAALEEHAIVQPFMRLFRLPQGMRAYQGIGETWRSFAYVHSLDSQLVQVGNFHQHGHTGLAWAGRRDWLARYGLYDALVSGSADHMMAHAISGDFCSACVTRILKESSPLRSHFLDWGQQVFEALTSPSSDSPSSDLQPSPLGFVPGAVLHLWHGETENRQYVTRHDELMAAQFDPHHDLKQSPQGAWEWASDKPALHQWAIDYFAQRQEDGKPGEAV